MKAEDGYFLGGTINNKGDVFLMTDVSQGFIKIARYENDKAAPSKVLQFPIDLNDDIEQSLGDFHMIASKDDPLTVFMAASYPSIGKDREVAVARYDFGKGTVINNIQPIDKAYLKDLQKSYVPFSKKFNSIDLGTPQELKIKNVIEDQGRLIMALTSYTIDNKQTHSVINANDLLVNIFDERLNVQFQQIIPRSYVSPFIARLGAGMHIKNNSLYIVLNNNKGLAGYKVIYGQIDLKNGTITNITAIDKKNIKNSYAAEPYSSLWFNDEFVLNYMEDKGWYEKSADAHLQIVTF